MTTKNFKTLFVWDTIYCADSVEWCPFEPYKNSFACGTYQLVDSNKIVENGEKNGQERKGGISIFTVFKDKLEESQSLKCSAVLDLKWCPKKLEDNIVLASANAAGEVCIFYFENKLLKFMSKCLLKKEAGDFLALSLDWGKEDSSHLLCSSDSKGNVTLIKFFNGALGVLKEWNAHSLETWIVCFNSSDSNIIYSGGDDAQLKVWDSRYQEPCKIMSSTKHTAGVTALNSIAYKEYNLISGSYDESILFWDVRNLMRPVGEIAASGGIWRLKLKPKSESRYLLSACVYGGFQIYNTNSYTVIGEFKEHESLAYGADWCHLNNSEVDALLGCGESALLATCSFYDHKLCVALWNENINI